jgi:hypothetical protein
MVPLTAADLKRLCLPLNLLDEVKEQKDGGDQAGTKGGDSQVIVTRNDDQPANDELRPIPRKLRLVGKRQDLPDEGSGKAASAGQ